MHTAFFTIFGEVLFDNFQDGSRILGGAPFNVAWHLQALGRQALFISRVGEDDAGREILATMQSVGMTRSGMQIDAAHPTGSVAISITDGQPSYRILDRQAYDYIDTAALQHGPKRGLLYHGSLALRNQVSRQTLLALQQTWNGPVFLDVNLRAPWWQADEVLGWIAGAAWLKLNDEELELLVPGEQSISNKMHLLQQTYQLSGVVVTRGSQGAMALDSAGEIFSIAPDGNIDIVDTVGAGDAFAAVLLLGIAENWPLAVTLKRAQDFASALVGRRGATVADPTFYQGFIDAWRE
ncbi:MULTISPECIES: carbohydrate kinase family protein [Methylomonas]|uniref:Carbohydrate kinase n=2 Tax=Methylomonas TaxID=416 RepID=A0A126T1D9_9GAMM|nr:MULTISPECIES: carbohydrate kinase [Methylomonas]AMK75901.1 carbohydrate kinase [Methylomonas denitrificans]OAI01290.1 carbohydrate kinase [Methylomonas methanica]TCV79224.1 fructokinase [Methylomonas methanica]